jgi:hypothetical protein
LHLGDVEVVVVVVVVVVLSLFGVEHIFCRLKVLFSCHSRLTEVLDTYLKSTL